MTLDPKRWRADSKFTHKMIPRWEHRPEGPFMESMVECTCGALWNEHEFSTGACPVESRSRDRFVNPKVEP